MKRLLKDWIAAYVEFTQHTEAPEKFHKWTAISTIAGALRRKTWIDMGYFLWSPNFYIIFVAPPGVVAKSTTMGIGMDLLREIPSINFGPASATWQALIAKLNTCAVDYEMEENTYFPMACLTVAVSELGTLIDFNNKDLVNVLTDLWDCKTGDWEKLTKTTTSENIQNPWINIIGCTTPSWVADNCNDYFSGGGLASRLVFVYADKKRKFVAYPQRHIPPNFEDQKNALIHDLTAISELRGEFTITEECFDWGEKWYEDHQKAEHKHLSQERFAGYIQRKQAHIHKIAMVLSASTRSDLVIDKDILMQANVEVSVLEKEMPFVFGATNRESEVVLAAEILHKIKGLEKVKKQKFYQEHGFKVMTYDTYERIIKTLQLGGFVDLIDDNGTFYIEFRSDPSATNA